MNILHILITFSRYPFSEIFDFQYFSPVRVGYAPTCFFNGFVDFDINAVRSFINAFDAVITFAIFRVNHFPGFAAKKTYTYYSSFYGYFIHLYPHRSLRDKDGTGDLSLKAVQAFFCRYAMRDTSCISPTACLKKIVKKFHELFIKKNS